MTQLIENKPPRRALIATLLRFCPSACVTPFLIDSGYRLEADLSPCRINANAISNRRWIAVSPSCSLAGPISHFGISNRNIPRLETDLTRAESARDPLLIATNTYFANPRFSRACCARQHLAGWGYSAARRAAQKAQLWLAMKLVSWVGDGGMSDWKLPTRGLKFCHAGTPGLLGVPNLAKLVQ